MYDENELTLVFRIHQSLLYRHSRLCRSCPGRHTRRSRCYIHRSRRYHLLCCRSFPGENFGGDTTYLATKVLLSLSAQSPKRQRDLPNFSKTAWCFSLARRPHGIARGRHMQAHSCLFVLYSSNIPTCLRIHACASTWYREDGWLNGAVLHAGEYGQISTNEDFRVSFIGILPLSTSPRSIIMEQFPLNLTRGPCTCRDILASSYLMVHPLLPIQWWWQCPYLLTPILLVLPPIPVPSLPAPLHRGDLDLVSHLWPLAMGCTPCLSMPPKVVTK